MSEPCDLLGASYPVAAFVKAHSAGQPIGLRTSGTSGRNRWVVRTTTSWTESFAQVNELLEMGRDARVWIPGTLSATMNLFAAVHAHFRGVRLVDGPESATHIHLTPSHLRRLLNDGVDLVGRHLVVAGDRLSAGLADTAAAAGAWTSHYYGSAELSFVAWGRDAADLWPFPGVDVQVRDETIWARSAYLGMGYWGTPGALQFDDGFATVGDRGSFRNGRLMVHGRGDAAVTTGAATILVADVEAVLGADALGDVVAVGLPHAELGQVLGVALTHPADVTRVRDACQTLDHAQRPRRWFVVEELPVTAAGKVDRDALVHALVSHGAGVRMLT